MLDSPTFAAVFAFAQMCDHEQDPLVTVSLSESDFALLVAEIDGKITPPHCAVLTDDKRAARLTLPHKAVVVVAADGLYPNEATLKTLGGAVKMAAMDGTYRPAGPMLSFDEAFFDGVK